MLWSDIGWLVLAGFGTGILGALLGIGGGTLIVPILVIAFHVPIHFAIAASLLAVIATSSASASVFLGKKMTNIRLGMTLEMFTALGGIIGALIAINMRESILQYIFSGMLVCTAVGMLKRPKENVQKVQKMGYLGAEYYDEKLKSKISYKVVRLPLGFLISLVAGTFSGLLGIGGGTVKVPAMVLAMKIPMKAATSTSDMMIGVTAIAGLFIYYAHNELDLMVASSVAIGTFLGSLLGAHFVAKIQSRTLSFIFSILLLLTAVEMILRASGVNL